MVTSVNTQTAWKGVEPQQVCSVRSNWHQVSTEEAHLVALRVSRGLVLSKMSKGILVHAKKVLELWFSSTISMSIFGPAKWFWTNIKNFWCGSNVL